MPAAPDADPGRALRERAGALARFERWAEAHPQWPDPAAAVRQVGVLWEALPADLREREPDASGVLAMHRNLAVLGAAR